MQGGLEGIAAAQGELQRTGFHLDVPDIEITSGNTNARSTSRFRIVGNKVDVVEEKKEDIGGPGRQ